MPATGWVRTWRGRAQPAPVASAARRSAPARSVNAPVAIHVIRPSRPVSTVAIDELTPDQAAYRTSWVPAPHEDEPAA